MISKIKCQETNKKFLEGGILCTVVEKGGSPPVLNLIAIHSNEAKILSN